MIDERFIQELRRRLNRELPISGNVHEILYRLLDIIDLSQTKVVYLINTLKQRASREGDTEFNNILATYERVFTIREAGEIMPYSRASCFLNCKERCSQLSSVPVTIVSDLSCTGKNRERDMLIDKCVADIVDALSRSNILMRASCCGHGECDGEILLQDGRTLKIMRPENKGGTE